MALSLWYDDPVSGPVDITGYVVYGIGQIILQTKAEQGALATCQIVVEDPDGIFDFQGLRPFWAEESECDFERLYTGWIWSKDYTRGGYRTGAARQVTIELQDLNHILWQKVMAGSDTDRPEETDVERVQWLLSTGEAGLIGDTTTYVSTLTPVDMDANPDSGYNGQMFQNVIDDCAQQSGKNYFMLDVLDGSDYIAGIWYGADSLDEFVSEATISNVLSEVDNVTVFWGDLSANFNKEPSRLYSGIFGNYDGGFTYQSNATTIANYGNRDTTAAWPNVKTHDKAVARAQRQLLTLNVEEEAVTVKIWSMLPSQANVFRAGMRVNGVKFTHFPRWESGRDCRIVTKTLTDQTEGLYSVELDLLPIAPFVPSGVCATSVLAAEVTAETGPVSSFGPYSVPVASASSADVAQVCSLVVSEGTGFVSGTPAISSPWSTMASFVNPDVVHTLIKIGYILDQSPANMDVGGVSAGGGAPLGIGNASAFPASAFVQVSPIDTSHTYVTLPSAPTPGNILHGVFVAEHQIASSALDGFWTVISNDWYVGGNLGVNGIGVVHVIRCANDDDTDQIQAFVESFAHWSVVSEWTP